MSFVHSLSALNLPWVTQVPFDADTAADDVLDGLTLLAGIGIGMLGGLLLGIVLTSIAKLIGRKEVFTRLLFRRITRPLLITCLLSGGYLGLGYTLSGFDVSTNKWIGRGEHLLALLVIAGLTWLLANAMFVIEDIARRDGKKRSKERFSRMFTQAQIIRRVLQAVIVVLGVAIMILTFPSARVAMSSVLASAGVASIVATLAAKSMLANVLAGLQLAMTDAIRVQDVIQIEGLDGAKEFGEIEEITLTYVVIKLYDERRMVVPSSRFTEGAFENWSRRAHQMLGTVELYLDYTAPIGALRARVDYLLSMTDLWDGRTASVTVTEMTEERITVRILVSARNSDDIWTLRCYLREEMIAWVTSEIPWALVTKRIRPLQVEQVKQDRSIQEITELAEELAGISGPEVEISPSLLPDSNPLGADPGPGRAQKSPKPATLAQAPRPAKRAAKPTRDQSAWAFPRRKKTSANTNASPGDTSKTVHSSKPGLNAELDPTGQAKAAQPNRIPNPGANSPAPTQFPHPHPVSPDQLAESHRALADPAGQSASPAHQARLKAARSRARNEIIRRSLLSSRPQIKNTGDLQLPVRASGTQETDVMDSEELAKLAQHVQAKRKTPPADSAKSRTDSRREEASRSQTETEMP